MLLHAQTGEISGRVFNAKQEPLWGSNVYLTGTIYGAFTDSDTWHYLPIPYEEELANPNYP